MQRHWRLICSPRVYNSYSILELWLSTTLANIYDNIKSVGTWVSIAVKTLPPFCSSATTHRVLSAQGQHGVLRGRTKAFYNKPWESQRVELYQRYENTVILLAYLGIINWFLYSVSSEWTEIKYLSNQYLWSSRQIGTVFISSPDDNKSWISATVGEVSD